ncbi:hypothetical protein D8X55_04555 [Malacoplasma penetrans]|uniref:Uncharacterized protein n=1 Tax=Malacoplasma penetrans (strain HF-2) TaxID=272633 RepID=Q8EVM1_MALP2|nr:hypothetical protein [Malacoplasma penetrans]RXY96161.1 hypothetical protein D8X55_04555 [Malacoplasma penetrans]BAC44332.1 hypothetical protein [Malacoplasma penetrans HF-2]
MIVKKILLAGIGIATSSAALATAITVPISQSQINSSTNEVPNNPNSNNEPNQNGNNNENNGEANPSPEIEDNGLIKDVKFPNSDIVFKDFTGQTYEASKSFAYQVYNKSITTKEDLNSKLKTWFDENKNKDKFNDLHFQSTVTLVGLGDLSEGYNYEVITFVDNSAQIIDSTTSQNITLRNKNFVYSFQVNLTPVSGHAWTDGSSVSKTLTVYGLYSGSVRKN